MSIRDAVVVAAPACDSPVLFEPYGLPAVRKLAAQPACTDRDLLDAYTSRGIVDIVSVPCSVTDTWHALAAERSARGELNLVMTNHEGNLAGIAGGIWFGTGRTALVHMQNSGLPNAGDGFVSFADPEVYGVPMAAMVTFRGATPADQSEPHQAIGRRTDLLCEAIFGGEAVIEGGRWGRDLLASVERSADAALDGRIGVVKVAEAGFRKVHRAALPTGAGAHVRPDVRELRRTKGIGSLPSSMCVGRTLSREAAIRTICERHPEAAILFCNGFTSRAARATCDSPRCFYNIGYMGGTMAIAWGLAKSRPDIEVVVVDGDQNALMSAMKDQLASDYPPNLHWYILDNGIGASVGTSESMPLGPAYDDLARIVRTVPDAPGSFAFPRVRAESQGAALSTLAQRFRNWLAACGQGVLQ